MNSIPVNLYIFLAFTADFASSYEYIYNYSYADAGSNSKSDADSKYNGDSIVNTNTRTDSEIEEYQRIQKMPRTNVKFVLTARGFPPLDSGHGAPDPFVKITYYGGSDSARYEGEETSVMRDNYNPEWPEVFEINYSEGRRQKFKLVFLDDDYPRSPPEYMGEVEMSLADMVNAPRGKLEKEILGPFMRTPKLDVYVLVNNIPTDDTTYRLTENKRHRPIRFKRLIEVYE